MESRGSVKTGGARHRSENRDLPRDTPRVTHTPKRWGGASTGCGRYNLAKTWLEEVPVPHLPCRTLSPLELEVDPKKIDLFFLWKLDTLRSGTFRSIAIEGSTVIVLVPSHYKGTVCERREPCSGSSWWTSWFRGVGSDHRLLRPPWLSGFPEPSVEEWDTFMKSLSTDRSIFGTLRVFNVYGISERNLLVTDMIRKKHTVFII